MAVANGALTRARGLPLAWVVTGAVVALVVAVAALIAAEAWTTGQKSLRALGAHLVEDVSLRTLSEVRGHVDPAVPLTTLATTLVRNGTLDVWNDDAVLTFLEAAIDANPSVTWASFGRADGRYLAVFRWPGEAPRRTSRLAPYEREDQRLPDGTWELRAERETAYDPRARPWYRTAAAADAGAWTPPYVFLSRFQIGVAYGLAMRDADGTVQGVFAAEFEAGTLSTFLSELRVSENGRVYLLDREGRIVAHPEGMPEDLAVVPTVADRADPLLTLAWGALAGRDLDRYQALRVDGVLITARPFPASVGIPWLVVTVVPEEDYVGPIRASVRRAGLIALAVLLLGIAGAVVLSRRLVRMIAQIQEEMQRIALFDLDEVRLGEGVTGIREINAIARSTDAMKEGLRSFSRYVPHQLVRSLLRAGGEARLGAERRVMTVLFTDIAGFTTVVEQTEPDVVLHALGEYLQRMNTEIHATDGTVCQYLGDAIEAFWGAPEPVDDHALRACRSALAMRDVSRALVATADAEGRPRFPTRLGVNTGEVMVGNVGAPERFNYAIVGDPVNTAARLESLNKVYGTEILVGPTTRAAAGDALVFRPVDWVRVKGRRQPAKVYELVGATAPPDVADALARYEDALDAYRERRFDDAIGLLDAVRATLPDDGPSAVLRARCVAFLAQPPPADWDGVHELMVK